MKALQNLCKNVKNTELPLGIFFVVFVILFLNAMTMTMPSSFLPEFLKSLGISEVETGSFAGVIAAAFAMGQTVFSFFWGYMADVRGRKFSLLLSALLLSVTTLGFGCSYNFYWAFITRLLQGCSTGIIVISNAIITAYCNDASLPFGLSIVSGAYCFGLIMGPSIGGFLAFPTEQYPNSFGNTTFLKTLPILLPNMVSSIGLLISIILVVCVIPNDGELQRHVENSYLIDETNKTAYGAMEASERVNDERFYTVSLKPGREESMEVSQSQLKKKKKFKIVEPLLAKKTSFRTYFTKGNLKNLKILKLFRSKDCMKSCILYGTYSICAVSYREIFPVFAATSKDYNGLQFKSAQIGIVIFVAAIVQITISLLFVPKLSVRFGAIKVFLACILLYAIMIPLTPLSSLVGNKHVLWFLVIFIQIVVRVCLAGCFLCINVLLNNSVEPELLGSANGLGMTSASLGKVIGPLIFGVTYSWSLTNVKGAKENKSPLGFPFNEYFTFFVISILSVLNGVFILTFPRLLEKKKILVNENVTNEELAKTKKLTYITAYAIDSTV